MKRSSEGCDWNNNLQGLREPNSSEKEQYAGELDTLLQQAGRLDLAQPTDSALYLHKLAFWT